MIVGLGVTQSVQSLAHGPDDQDSTPGRISKGTFLPRHHVETSAGAHAAPHPMGTGVEAAEARSRPLTSIHYRGQECVQLYLHSPDTYLLRGA